MKSLISLLLVAALAGLSGCVSSQNAMVNPGTNLGAVKSFYVVHLPRDGRNVNQLICDDLVRRGLKATTGETGSVPPDADAVVTYQDKWVWDITMYMLQLDLQIRAPKTDFALASGQVMHTSIIRRSPPEMVKEVLDQIFQKASAARGAAPMGGK